MTEKELLNTLEDSDHVFLDPDVRQKREGEELALHSLDESNTPGDGHPDIYYGKNKNAKPPSGEFYDIAEEGAWRDRDLPLAVGGREPDNKLTPNVSDFLTVGGELGSTTIQGHEVTVSAKAGLEISGKINGKLGGELFLDITAAAGGHEVTVSPGGFGFYVGPDHEYDSWCVTPNINLPGPLPGGEIDACGDILVYTRDWSDPEIQFGIKFTGLDICADPCGPINCEVCGTVVSASYELKTGWYSVPNLPFDVPDDWF